MPSRRSQRALRPAALLIALCTVLSACASAAPVGTPTAKDVVGTCKRIGTGDEMVTNSDVSPAVSCAGPHVYETYAVIPAPASISKLIERPGPELAQAQTAGACPYKPVRPYLGADEFDSQWGIEIWQKLPTRAEWRSGVRVVVCDLVVSASKPDTVPLVDLSLRNAMRYSDSARIRLCRTTASIQAYTTCNHPHIGEGMGVAWFPRRLHGAALLGAGRRFCAGRMHDFAGRMSLPGFLAEWTPTDGTKGVCWLTSTHGLVIGTERAGLVPR